MVFSRGGFVRVDDDKTRPPIMAQAAAVQCFFSCRNPSDFENHALLPRFVAIWFRFHNVGILGVCGCGREVPFPIRTIRPLGGSTLLIYASAPKSDRNHRPLRYQPTSSPNRQPSVPEKMLLSCGFVCFLSLPVDRFFLSCLATFCAKWAGAAFVRRMCVGCRAFLYFRARPPPESEERRSRSSEVP